MSDKIIKRNDLAAMAMPSPESLNALVEQYKTINDFQKLLDSSPDKKYVRKNKQVRNEPEHLPIDIVEAELNRMFGGLWNVYITDFHVIVNELLYMVQLEVFHPIARVWLSRCGTGAAQIRLIKDTEIDVRNKIKTTIIADAPHALSEAIKNAAKKFGKKLGGGLNREDKALDYADLDDLLADDEEMSGLADALAACTTKAEVRELWTGDMFSHLHGKPLARDMVVDRGKELP